MTIYAGVNDIAEKVVKVYVGINGEARLIQKAYAGVNGIARLVYQAPFLPDAYRQVEYIQSSGTQYIDTSVKVKTTTKISIDYQMAGYLSGNFQGIMGIQGSSASHRFYVAASSTNKQQYGLGNGYGEYTEDNDRRSVIVDGQNKQVFVNGVYVAPASGSYSNFNNNNVNIEICSIYSAINSVQRYSVCKVYSAKIYDAGSIVRDFYPCVRKSDSAVGLYDLQNDTFYGNAGSGVFIAGPDYIGEL